MKSKAKINQFVLLCLTTCILFIVFAISNRVLAQESDDEVIYAVSNQGEMIDFRALALSIAETQNTDEYYDKMMPPRLPQGSDAIEMFFPDGIIGEDNRVKVDDTTIFPYSAVVKIDGMFLTYTFGCSGWMLGPNTIVTAAHCIYDYGTTNAFAHNVTVTPALNASNAPFGVCDATRMWIIDQWQLTGNSGYDYGIYKLDCHVGEQTGTLGYRVYGDAEIDGQRVTVTGYPDTNPDNVDGGTTMWFGLGYVVGTSTRILAYDNDTSIGQSGGPVWELISDSCMGCVVAIHSGQPRGVTSYNVGVRINDDVFDFLFVMEQLLDDNIHLPLILRNSGSGNGTVIINPYPAPISVNISNPYP